MKCEFCGAEVSDEHRVCTSCGSVVSPKVMNDKTNLVIDIHQQGAIGEKSPMREYKIQANEGFSEQSISVQNRSTVEIEKNPDLPKQHGEVAPQQFMVQNQSKKESKKQVTLQKNEGREPRVQRGVSPQSSAEEHYNIGSNQNFQNRQTAEQINMQERHSLITREEFFKLKQVKTCKDFIFPAIIILYLSAVYSLISNVFLPSSGFGLIQVTIIVISAVGLQFKQSRACAVILLVYSAINSVLYNVFYGSFGEWWIFIAGVLAVIGTFKLEKMWKEYLRTGIIPNEQ